MLLDLRVEGESLVARPVGELDLQVADALRRHLVRHLGIGRARNLVLNLSRVSFIDSSGLGVILGRYRQVKALGGEMAIVGPTPPVNRVLELAGLHRLVRFFASEEEALESLEGGGGSGQVT
jgi:stage II sporulation protein AA (anti-sigma F factor antagonist)